MVVRIHRGVHLPPLANFTWLDTCMHLQQLGPVTSKRYRVQTQSVSVIFTFFAARDWPKKRNCLIFKR
jgi:hypothetical protein